MNNQPKMVRELIKESHTAIEYEHLLSIMAENLGENRRNRILIQYADNVLNYCSYNEIMLMRSLLSADIFAQVETKLTVA